MPDQDVDALARKYGGVSVEDVAKQYGGTAVEPQAAAPPEEQTPALSRFFSSLGTMLQGYNPIAAVSEYANRPSQWAAVSDVLGTKRGTPEEAAALERGMTTPLPLPGGMGEVVPVGFHPLAGALEQGLRGDIAGAAGTLTGGYAVPAAAVKAFGAVATPTGRAQLARGYGKATEAVGKAVEKLDTAMHGEPSRVTLLTKALKPRDSIKFQRDVNTAMPEINESAGTLGKPPVANVDDMLESVKDAKQRVWAQRVAMTGDQGSRGISLEPAADAIEKTITPRMKLHDPAAVQAIQVIADRYRGRTFTIQEAEELIHGGNAELKRYYAKNPAAQQMSAAENPDTAALVAETDAIRKTVYGHLDQAGGGEGPRTLGRRYGALAHVEEELRRRKNVMDRQPTVNVGEAYAAIEGAGKLVRGAIRGKFGDPGGVADIAEGLAMRQAAKEVSELNNSNRLIERAFRNYTQRPVPVNVAPFQPKALLGSGPIITPPPADPSGITVTTGPPLKPRIRGELPAPPLVTPPPADPSGITVTTGPPLKPRIAGQLPAPPLVTAPPADLSGMEIIDAARKIARDPKTGRFFVYYTSEPR
jgi:hypothetical protein